MPGFEPEEIHISITGDLLTIKGEVSEERESGEDLRYHIRERRYGRISRSIRLPANIEAGKGRGDFEHGVLTLTFPMVVEAMPKTITLKAKK